MSKHSWQTQLSNALSTPKDILNYLNLDLGLNLDLDLNKANQLFKTRVPTCFLDRVQKNLGLNDPILKQILPDIRELEINLNYTDDPLLEQNKIPQKGIIHKYHGRVLLILSTACAVNCRYCFRRAFPYENNRLNQKLLNQAFEYIQNDLSISEVILSGGDPLLIKDSQLEKIIRHLESIPHLRRLRIHSRMPIVLPDRVTDRLCDILNKTRLVSSIVMHCNHPQELDENVKLACNKLKNFNIPLFNQAVLLKDINDTLNTQIKLSEKLFEYGIIPYYLHCLDKVSGSAHFDLSMSKIKKLYQSMQEYLPGYLVPKLVRDIPNEKNKVRI